MISDFFVTPHLHLGLGKTREFGHFAKAPRMLCALSPNFSDSKDHGYCAICSKISDF